MSKNEPAVESTEIRALRQEAVGYLRIGAVDRARAVNDELAARGADPVDLPAEPKPRKAVSHAAETRRKRKS